MVVVVAVAVVVVVVVVVRSVLFFPASQVCSLSEAWRERWAGCGLVVTVGMNGCWVLGSLAGPLCSLRSFLLPQWRPGAPWIFLSKLQMPQASLLVRD